MLTVDKLREYGADVDSGLERCMDSEDFYLKLVGRFPQEKSFVKLDQALAENDLDAAFEAAHALKGVAANLSLTPIYEPICEITELLRSRTQMDYHDKLEVIHEQREIIQKMISEE